MATLQGGYYMIDCAALNLLSQTTQTSTRLYAELKSAISVGKPVFAYNVLWGSNNPMTAIPLMVNYESSDTDTIVATASTLQIYVAKTGEITIVNLAPSN